MQKSLIQFFFYQIFFLVLNQVFLLEAETDVNLLLIAEQSSSLFDIKHHCAGVLERREWTRNQIELSIPFNGHFYFRNS